MTINKQQQNLKQPTGALQKNRLAYIDNIKALVIILVIVVHVAVTYSGMGFWFYMEPKTLNSASHYFFSFILMFNQAYILSLFFLIAAYFIPRSLDKKGAKKFIQDRLFRLGIPTIIFMFIVFPGVFKMGNPDINLFEFYKSGITSFGFLSWQGPMWFALTLLMFSLIYVPFNNLFIKLANKCSFTINIKNVFGLIAIITISAFTIRLFYPIGTLVVGLQFCFFAAYIFMFLIGILAYRKNILEKMSYTIAKKWFITAVVFGISFWMILMSFGTRRLFAGGWNFSALGYALWESFFCVAIIIGLIGIFKKWFNTQNSLQKFLSDNAFGVYVFHPVVVVATSVLLKNINIYPILKFIVVVLITVPLSFIFAAMIRKVRILQKLFS
ncbi:MAG: acyltransferase family protein [Gammaproteobacteria bacterium]